MTPRHTGISICRVADHTVVDDVFAVRDGVAPEWRRINLEVGDRAVCDVGQR